MNRFLYYYKRIICVLKALLAKIIIAISQRELIHQNIWLFEEKYTEARDNAYHLYVYVKKEHPEIRSFYVIKKDSVDERKIDKYGTTIHADTLKHYIYWIGSKYSISSQPYGAAPNPREWLKKFQKWCRKDQKVVFLQHGITYNNLPSLDYHLTDFALFSCTALPELKYIREGLHYPKEKAQLLGFCRYDQLVDNKARKIVLIMPTYRKWLASRHTDLDATEAEMKDFIESDFYHCYSEILTNKLIQQCAERNGYKIIFYLHYSLQSYTQAFLSCNNHIVEVADRRHFDVQQLLKDSSVLITDYSSVFFDFAYMGKPEIYYQFDKDLFYGKHYKKGYFDFHRDGFGPVFTKSNELVKYLIELIENGCNNSQQYLDRIQSFFPYRDAQNCERTYNAIIHLT